MKITNEALAILAYARHRVLDPLPKMAEALGVSATRVRRVIQSSIEQGRVFPCLAVSAQALGLRRFLVFGELNGVGLSQFDGICELIGRSPTVDWIACFSGDYDLGFTITARDEAEVDRIIGAVVSKYGRVFARTSVLRERVWHSFEQKFLYPSTQRSRIVRTFKEQTDTAKVDRLDIELLNKLALTPLMSGPHLARELRISVQTLYYRIERLKQRKVLLGCSLFQEHTKLGLESRTFLLRLSSTTLADEHWLFSFASTHPHIVAVGRFSGEWDFQVLVEAAEEREIEHVRTALLDHFHDTSPHLVRLRLDRGIKAIPAIPNEFGQSSSESPNANSSTIRIASGM